MKPRKCVYGFLALKSKGLVVGINTDPPTRDRKTKVARFIARHQIKFPILLDYFQTLKQYRVEQIPYTVLIDRQGKIVNNSEGERSRAFFQKHFERLVRSPQVRRSK